MMQISRSSEMIQKKSKLCHNRLSNHLFFLFTVFFVCVFVLHISVAHIINIILLFWARTQHCNWHMALIISWDVWLIVIYNMRKCPWCNNNDLNTMPALIRAYLSSGRRWFIFIIKQCVDYLSIWICAKTQRDAFIMPVSSQTCPPDNDTNHEWKWYRLERKKKSKCRFS